MSKSGRLEVGILVLGLIGICAFLIMHVFNLKQQVRSLTDNQNEIALFLDHKESNHFKAKCEKARRVFLVSNGGRHTRSYYRLQSAYGDIWRECYIETDRSMHFLNEERLNGLLGIKR